MKIQILLFIVALAGVSCEYSNIAEPAIDFVEAIQLQKGNYWVYQLAANGGSLAIDSTYIKKDTLINDQVYFIFENSFGKHEIKTKQSNTIVSLEGDIEFSATNFTDTLYRSFDGTVTGVMKKVDGYITVPAGTFKTIMFAVLERVPSSSTIPGKADATHIYERKVWYAAGIGVVKSESYYEGSLIFTNSLVRYKVK